MKKTVVLGAGRMGRAVSYAMEKLGHCVYVYDKDQCALDLTKKHVPAATIVLCEGTEWIQNQGCKIIAHSDVVISCLPYHQTEEIAKKCIKSNIRYCDLGGRVDVSKSINNFSKEYNREHASPVFTDLGLAPGLVNILAEWGYNKLGGADKVSMMVGGLPANKLENPLKYAVTWSVDGLINEYRDDCKILEGGSIKTVKGMDGLEIINSKHLGDMEAFYTSGGSSHTVQTMHERGVKNCSYKTIRYVGHCEIVKFLIRDCELSHDCLKEIFMKGCYDDKAIKDLVLVRVDVGLGDICWGKEIIIYADSSFSAMQKATAFSVASVADIMSSGSLDVGPSLTYKDVPFELFKCNIQRLGITI